MENLELYNKLRVVPAEAKKEIQAGRLKGFTDINPMWRIKMLTDTFGICGFGWYYDVIEQKQVAVKDEIAVFVTIHLFVKVGDEWSKPIVGLGGSKLAVNEKNGLYVSDEAFKMALTDAIGISCKALGMAADVYFDKDRSKYDLPSSEPLKTDEKTTEYTPNKEKEWLNILDKDGNINKFGVSIIDAIKSGKRTLDDLKAKFNISKKTLEIIEKSIS